MRPLVVDPDKPQSRHTKDMSFAPDKLLSDLIAIPSVNPAFAAPGDRHAGEQMLCNFIADTLAKSGIEVELHNIAEGRPNLIARLKPAKRTRCRVILAPHTDTVAGSPEQFIPRNTGNRIYGRGACDTKGSLAVACTVLTQLALTRTRPARTEILVVAFADEEYAQLGSRTFAKSGVRADLAIVGEPTSLKVVTAHKGSLWLEFKTRGKAAHGSTPHHGKNAIYEMARLIACIETHYTGILNRRKHPLLGSPTISVGTIHGGIQPNTVPDACRIIADRRTLPGETDTTVCRELKALLKANKLHASVRSVKPAPCPPLDTNPEIPLVRMFLDCAHQTMPAGVDFFCDAAALASSGIPSVVFGPGNNAHA
ncbi:MAG: M20 family metallopeptidase, partial [Verrucomicrobiota bacterium]|nr:M20 family metallopeptidase [Verrucomicrobiota bacterium]